MASRAQMLEALKQSVAPLSETKPFIKALIYGESGVGKTVAALQLAQSIKGRGKILYIDAVEGWVSLRNHSGLMDDVIRIKYEGLSQLELIHDLFVAGDDFVKDVEVVIFDEISVIAKNDLDVVLKASLKSDPNKDPDVPTWPDMNANTHRMRKMTINFMKLDVHQIYLSHLREDEDKNLGYKVRRPEFMPKLNTTIREGLHLVAFMKADERKHAGNIEYVRSLQVHPTKTVVAKSRIGGMGIHTTMSDLIKTTVEWMQGKVDTVEVQDVVDDTTSGIFTDDDPGIEVQ